MTTHTINYSRPHYVLLTLQKDTASPSCCTEELAYHQQYYQELAEAAKAICYREVMHRQAICVLLWVSSDNEVEEVIDNDPLLKEGVYAIKDLVPFATAPDRVTLRSAVGCVAEI